VPKEVSTERYDRLMQHQQAISAELLRSRVGRTIEVMVDKVDEVGAVTRSHWIAPEIDGSIYLRGETGLKPGDRLMITVEDSKEYDLWASPSDSRMARFYVA